MKKREGGRGRDREGGEVGRYSREGVKGENSLMQLEL